MLQKQILDFREKSDSSNKCRPRPSSNKRPGCSTLQVVQESWYNFHVFHCIGPVRQGVERGEMTSKGEKNFKGMGQMRINVSSQWQLENFLRGEGRKRFPAPLPLLTTGLHWSVKFMYRPIVTTWFTLKCETMSQHMKDCRSKVRWNLWGRLFL